ncbi:Threonine/homoserine exporter RhtA [Baekduia alba]|uniref:EamA family transporter n=1 Tax=Baekduia alba TaxID=2997333 RepID=UPI00234219DD|nr:EamA family transporter [Baekduia alba]WCB96368.1 Threonine/homoserine exporter RhtA [Baekduia alba]
MPTATAQGLPGLDRIPPIALVLSGVTSIQFGAAVAATLFDDLGPAGTSVLRLTWAAVILMALVRPRVRGRSARDLRLVALFGLTLGGMNVFFYEALDRIPLGVAVTIEFAGPLGVAVAMSRRRLDLVWAALAAVGIVLLSNPFGAGLDTVGLVLTLAAAACWAAYILIAQRATTAYEGSEGLALAMVVAALVPLVPGVAEAGTTLLEPQWLALGACVALASSVIPYSLETEALRRLPANVFGVLMSMEPAVAVLAGFVILGQSLDARELVAMALVVVASVGSSRTAPASAEA